VPPSQGWNKFLSLEYLIFCLIFCWFNS